MPTTKEFTILLEDRPGTLGKLCQALAEQSVNILARFILALLRRARALSASCWTIRQWPNRFSTAKRQTTLRLRLRE